MAYKSKRQRKLEASYLYRKKQTKKGKEKFFKQMKDESERTEFIEPTGIQLEDILNK